MPVQSNVCLGNLQSMVANSHKIYSNELFNNDNVLIQSAYAGRWMGIREYTLQSFYEVEQ